MASKKKLSAKISSIQELEQDQVKAMFDIYNKYYGGAIYENFHNDLMQKNKVILLYHRGQIRGFSTILNYHFELEGKKVQGLFSGDTIIEREYWGGSALQMAFIKNMIVEKLKRPLSPLYWFLISKGYKTYLCMANNFKEHYPRYEKETPQEMKGIMDQFAKSLYKENYDPQSGLITFEGVHDHLKGDVAPITSEMCEENQRINFFSRKNSTWQEGSELVCLARFDLGLPIRYGFKSMNKSMSGSLKKLVKGISLKPQQSLKKVKSN